MDKNENNKIFSVYEKIYFPSRISKIKYNIFCYINRIIFALLKAKNAFFEIFKPKFELPSEIIDDSLSTLPNPKNIAYIDNQEINKIRLELVSKTNGFYDKSFFKKDVFAKYLKPKHSTNEFLT